VSFVIIYRKLSDSENAVWYRIFFLGRNLIVFGLIWHWNRKKL